MTGLTQRRPSQVAASLLRTSLPCQTTNCSVVDTKSPNMANGYTVGGGLMSAAVSMPSRTSKGMRPHCKGK